MAKEKVMIEEKGNIENLASLRKEFASGKMLPRKSVMLKARLFELFKSEKITTLEQDLMELVLRKDRIKGMLSDADTQTLNWIERNRCEDICRCIRDDGATVLLLEKDKTYRYVRNDDTDRYSIYVEFEQKPEYQMTKELMTKEARGHFANESEYPKSRTDIRLLDLNEKFFNYYFEIEEDLLTGSPIKDETFVF